MICIVATHPLLPNDLCHPRSFIVQYNYKVSLCNRPACHIPRGPSSPYSYAFVAQNQFHLFGVSVAQIDIWWTWNRTYPVSLSLVRSPLLPFCLPWSRISIIRLVLRESVIHTDLPPSTTNLSIWKNWLTVACLCRRKQQSA